MSRHLPVVSSSERSQRLLQKLIANGAFGREQGGETVHWVSPIESDGFAEYRDEDFLKQLKVSTSKLRLNQFWPGKGPQWDALGRTEGGKLILVEAKAYVEEFDSTPTRAVGRSAALIRQSLEVTRKHMGVKSPVDWSRTFYQVTNRLAHLYFLSIRNDLPSALWFVYFCNHPDPRLATTQEEWRGAIRLVEAHLGLRGRKLMNCVRHIFVDSVTLKLINA